MICHALFGVNSFLGLINCINQTDHSKIIPTAIRFRKRVIMDNKIEILRFLIKSCERESLSVFNSLLKDLKLTANQVEVLTILNSYGAMSVKDLGNLLICEKKSPSRLVQSLIKKKLLVKKIDKSDKRVSLIALTAQGKELIPKINSANEKFNEIIEQKIYDPSQVDELIDILSSYLQGTDSISKIRRRFNMEE
ncbi:MarR family transcriptional regulator [Limosilactobacillus pontis]|uniref:MarR family transcriptional regulator n=2 Tax=Limosilactobacillus pontis TaxID=35787 RepID=A0A2J6NL55_9LACO|nr:MarR family transcriptional regulator [Limosilactobacillus pontis]